MTAELGVFFLILALMASLMQAAFLWPRLRARLAPCIASAAWLEALCVALALATLIALRLDSDFSVENVIMNSNRSLPILYKIAGAWGNHEGSMLLFALVLATFGAALSSTKNNLAVAIQGALGAGIFLFILLTSNPFARHFPPTADGEALNPLLQDIALSIHPPLLYVGYVGFSIMFSLAVAALIEGKCNRDWATRAHPWILVAWSALTFGIGLGSWWAYRVLGWGGFWFWDPVENASLLPWLSGTALLHANIVLKKRGALAQWVIMLAIVTFGLSLIGTFLVRSGALTSVHSFASDPMRGIFILCYFVATIGGALLLFGLRAKRFEPSAPVAPVSREGIIIVNNVFLLCGCATVALGTLYPLFAEWLAGEKLTVGAPYFNLTFLPLMIVPLLFAGLAPLMPWKQASLAQAFHRAGPAMMTAAASIIFVSAIAQREIACAMLGFALASWLFVASLQWLKGGQKHGLSVFLGHAGAAVLVAGITGAGLWKQDIEKPMAINDSIALGGYRITYKAQNSARAENYDATRADFTLSDRRNNIITTLHPEYRMYDIRRIATSETAIYSTWDSDLYAAIGETTDKKTSVRLYYVPLIRFLWLGFAMMGAGGITAIFTRKENA